MTTFSTQTNFSPTDSQRRIRKAAVAGMFYPDDARVLKNAVQAYLHDQQTVIKQAITLQPKALIVPHAGYVYSGAAAGAGFAALTPWADKIKRVVIFGPAHRVAIRGLALPDATAFETPLGHVALDEQAIAHLRSLPDVSIIGAAHAQEHSLEVQLPFLQNVLSDFTLVPLVVGGASSQQVKVVMDALWGDEDTLIVVSSDLSHFHNYNTARQLDQHTCSAIEHLNEKAVSDDQACGSISVRALLMVAQEKGLHATTVALCNSGDTAGDKSRVVGYGSWVFTHERT